ncbi:hypothetical protein V6N13_017775 [Hibiscus sabdariffa]|uniref:peroxidase n=1 Tax=Hibiscus sabdariffa TaxID=183260 RepID=A0ABR2CHF7_9ROSI
MGFNCFGHGVLLVTLLLALASSLVQGQGTRVGFYSRLCPRVESIVRSVVQSHFRSDPTVAPGLLRMHFHDCFVNGCDASILTDGAGTEKTAPPNILLRGYEVIDDANTQLEAACPGVVSCADILALAVRDFVVVSGGASWSVPTGRRDGAVSPTSDVVNLRFRDSNGDRSRRIGLDTESVNRLDNSFSVNLRDGKGILESDQRLWTDAFTKNFVQRFLGIRGLLGLTFNIEFGRSMVKMSNIQVKTGTVGEIRKVCSKII